MMKRVLSTAAENLLDLGVTVLYATFAGLLIAAVTLSDGGLASLLPALIYAALLPLAVFMLILVDGALRAFFEHRAARCERRRAQSVAGAGRPALR